MVNDYEMNVHTPFDYHYYYVDRDGKDEIACAGFRPDLFCHVKDVDSQGCRDFLRAGRAYGDDSVTLEGDVDGTM